MVTFAAPAISTINLICVISQGTLTTLIIPVITTTESNNCF